MEPETKTHLSTERGVSASQKPVPAPPSCVSMKTDKSLKEEAIHSEPGLMSGRPPSPVPSVVSMKSDHSTGDRPNMAGESVPSGPRLKSGRPPSPVPSSVSMKSDHSMGDRPNMREDHVPSGPRLKSGRPPSPVPSCVSMKSDHSTGDRPNMAGESVPSGPRLKSDRPSSPVPSGVSMKSDHSTGGRPNMRGHVPSDPSGFTQTQSPHENTTSSGSEQLSIPNPVRQQLHSQPFGMTSGSEDEDLLNAIKSHKAAMKRRFDGVNEGHVEAKEKVFFNKIYTELYITEGQSEDVNREHEVQQLAKSHQRQSHDTPISVNDIFKSSDGQRRHIKTVMTKGIAGIGKTVSVQKFILDWADGKANQDIDFIFVLPFRELNLVQHTKYSFHMVLEAFYPELEDPHMYENCTGLFILDGLDESRLEVDFSSDDEEPFDVSTKAPVGKLIENLIWGKLLPSALVWITSRPAVAGQIPGKYINQMTEIRGFNDEQKEEYFKKKIPDPDQARSIITHIRTSKSLFIMCHIPLFCWITATVLQDLLLRGVEEIPKTVTEMFSHFLLILTNFQRQKYPPESQGTQWDPQDLIVKLAKLAFTQLMKGNILFYEKDLEECGIKVREASVYSGICTDIFKEELVINQKKIYCFVHLSIQEFLAAYFVFHSFVNQEEFESEDEESSHDEENSEEEETHEDEDSEDEEDSDDIDTHWAFFFGFMFEDDSSDEGSENEDMSGVEDKASEDKASEDEEPPEDEDTSEDEATSEDEYEDTSEDEDVSEDEDEVVGNLDQPFKAGKLNHLLKRAVKQSMLCKNGKLDLFLRFLLGISLESNQKLLEGLLGQTVCSSESIEKTIQYIKKTLSKQHRSTKRCLNLLLCLLELKDSSLQKDMEQYMRSGQKLSSEQCSTLAYILLASEDIQDEFDLNKYNTTLEGNNRLVTAVRGCRKAKLSGCLLSSDGFESVTFALQSKNSYLRELDLSYINMKYFDFCHLFRGLYHRDCKVETLRLVSSCFTADSCVPLAIYKNSCVRDLDLSCNDLDSGMKTLSKWLTHINCKLEILRLASCRLTSRSYKTIKSTLQSENSILKELDLSFNDLLDSGVMMLSDGLDHPNCKLKTLRLVSCNITGESCGRFASVLQSRHSQLRVLDLSNNDLKDSGVKLLSVALGHYKLETLRLSGCCISDEGCEALASALASTSSTLMELDLSYNHPGDKSMDLLKKYKLKRLSFAYNGPDMLKTGPQKYACELTLDPNTAHVSLSLSEGNRKVTAASKKMPYPDHPERFQGVPQVLCTEGLSGCCYWEVNWRDCNTIKDVRGAIGVAYKCLQRKGISTTMLGLNNMSWSLCIGYNDDDDVYNDDDGGDGDGAMDGFNIFGSKAVSPKSIRSKRLGVYLDWPAGTLSFFSIFPDKRTHLHTIYATFTDPVYPGFMFLMPDFSLTLTKKEA